MPIDVQAPDGSIARFPDGTPDATIEKVMAETWGAPKKSGVAQNAKAGFVEGLTMLPDAVETWARKTFPGVGSAIDLAKHIADAAQSKNPAFVKLAKDQGKSPDQYAAELRTQIAPHQANLNNALPDSLNPENVEATGAGERIARGVGAGASGVFLPAGEGMTVANIIRNLTIGGAAGGGMAAAQEAAPDALKPAAGVLGAVGTALATHGAMTGAGAAARAAGGAAKTFAEPFMAGVSPGAAEAAAARRMAEAASDPAAVRAALEQPGEIIPGSEPTTFQQTGDMGLGGLERGVATRNPEAFATRRADQNAARTEALSELRQGADPNDVAKSLKGQFDALNAHLDADVNAATGEASGRSAAMGAEVTPDGAGAAVRGNLSENLAAAMKADGALWDAVDPERNLVGNIAETKEGKGKILAESPKSAKPPEGEEAAIYQAIDELPTLAPLQELIALRSRVSTAMREARKAGEDQANRRLSILRGHIEDNLSNSIAHQISADDAAVSRGIMQAEDSTLARIQRWTDQWLEDAGAGRSGALAGDQARAGNAAGGVRGVDGTGRATGGGPGGAARDQSLSAELGQAKADVAAHRTGQVGSISNAIRELGGLKLKDEAGAVLAGPDIVGSLSEIRTPGVVSGKGMSPENMAQALADRGWFGDKPGDASAALEAALAREAMGSKVYHPQSYEPGFKERLGKLDSELREAGATLADRPNVAAQKLADYRAGLAATRARAEALGIDVHRPIQDIAGDLAEREAIQAEAPPERDPVGEEFDRRVAQARGVGPSVDDAAHGRLKAASEATKQTKATFGAEPVKAALAEKGAKGDYRLPNGEVPGKFFKPGPGGYEAMQALLKASPESVTAMVDYAATVLRRRAADAAGVIDPKQYAAWAKAYKDALRALPEGARAKFADAAKAGETVADALANRTARLKAAQSGALGKVMNLTTAEDVTKTIGQVLNGRTAVADIQGLLKATKGDPVARAGLRQAVADFMTQKLVGNTEAGTSGAKQIRADAYLSFIKEKRGALNLVFKPEEVRTMEAIGEDIARAKRSENAVKLPGGSNTAQDQIAARKGGLMEKGGRTILDAIAAVGGFHLGGPIGGGVAVIGSHMLQSLRASGIERIDQLLTEAMLHPNVARELLKKAPAKPNPNATKPLAAALRTAQRASFAAVQAQPQDKRQ